MKAVVQRVKSSSLVIDGEEYSSINKGFMVLVGITDTDTKDTSNNINNDQINNLNTLQKSIKSFNL